MSWIFDSQWQNNTLPDKSSGRASRPRRCENGFWTHKCRLVLSVDAALFFSSNVKTGIEISFYY